jgi:hypothetical protein
MTDFGVHSFLFSKFSMWIFDVLGMQISPFESRRWKEYLNLKLTIFQIMTCAPIWLVRGKVRSKNMGFLKFYIIFANVMLGSNVTFYKKMFIKFFISINYGVLKLLVILQNPNKLKY